MSNNQTHQRKTINRNLFHDYTWLGCDENENTILHFCKLCRNRNGNTKLALGTTDLSLKEIKRHLETNEHEMSELQLQ
ncbi:1310_t:CDS:1, partial [Entrophospora sp. SA101]